MQSSPLNTSSLYSTVSNHDYLQFKDNGSIKHKRIADFLDFTDKDISRISGVKTVRLQPDRIPEVVKNRLEEIANICNLVAEVFEGDSKKTALWFRTPNPLLGYIAPKDMIRLGRYKKLLQFIINAREETKNPKELQ